MRRWLWLCLAAIATSCSDPYTDIASDPCRPGNSRTTGQACVLPNTSNSEGDWTGVPTIGLEGACTASCAVPLPTSLQMVNRDSEKLGPQLALRLRLNSAPVPEREDVRYRLALTALPAWPAPTLDVLELSKTGARYYKSGIEVMPELAAGQEQPFSAAWTEEGLEGWVVVGLLGVRGGVRIVAQVELPGEGGWETVWSTTNPESACWEASALKLDPCSTEAP